MATTTLYDTLASILSYPTDRIYEQAEWLHGHNPSDVQSFYEFIHGTRLAEIEESFTRSFDMNPTCCLEIGWHLYGEDYQRGEFLVNMRQALEEEGLPESTELPDHISHCLQLLQKLEPEDEKAFAQDFLQPAVAKILDGLEEDNPYTCVIILLQKVLEDSYGPTVPAEEDTESRLIELPVINDTLHYNNIEDMIDGNGKRK